jgi:hypothetical protein
VHDRPHPTVGEHRPHLLTHPGHDATLAVGALDRPAAQAHRGDAGPLAQQLVQVQLGLRAALHPDHQQPAVRSQRLDVRGQALGAHVVQDDVGPVPAGGFLERGRHVVVVVDDDVGAQVAAALQPVRRAGGGGHRGPERLGHLDGVAADAAAAALDQERLPGRQPAGGDDVGPDRAGHLGQPAGGHQVHAGRDREQLRGRHRDLLGVPAAGQQRAHLVPDRPAGDSLPERSDPPRALQSDNLRRAGRRRVVALALQQVGPVDGAGGHIQHDFAGAGLRVRHRSPLQHLRPTRLPHCDRVHGPRR